MGIFISTLTDTPLRDEFVLGIKVVNFEVSWPSFTK